MNTQQNLSFKEVNILRKFQSNMHIYTLCPYCWEHFMKFCYNKSSCAHKLFTTIFNNFKFETSKFKVETYFNLIFLIVICTYRLCAFIITNVKFYAAVKEKLCCHTVKYCIQFRPNVPPERIGILQLKHKLTDCVIITCSFNISNAAVNNMTDWQTCEKY